MAKINLNKLPLLEALSTVRKWQRNRYKNGTGNGAYSGGDPFVHQRNLRKRFICCEHLANAFITHLKSLNDKYSPYVENFE